MYYVRQVFPAFSLSWLPIMNMGLTHKALDSRTTHVMHMPGDVIVATGEEHETFPFPFEEKLRMQGRSYLGNYFFVSSQESQHNA